jgi:hypothetical protein
VTLQYLDGAMAAVLPSEYASRPLVLLPPSEADLGCTAGGLYTATLQCLRSPGGLPESESPAWAGAEGGAEEGARLSRVTRGRWREHDRGSRIRRLPDGRVARNIPGNATGHCRAAPGR